MSSRQEDPCIANRKSWLFVGVIFIFSILIAYKIATAPMTIDLSQLKFGDILNLFLAFFAIAMSVAFYFKATDTSNQFYDNTYKFTKELSEILGRIEAGFGERLRHLDEGYAGIRARFEHMPVDPIKAEQAIQKEEEEVKKQEEERKQLLEDLAKRARLENHEKQRLFQQLSQKERALALAQQELDFLRSRVMRSERHEAQEPPSLPAEFVDYILRRLVPELGGLDAIFKLNPHGIQRRFDSIRDQFPQSFIADLRRFGLLDKSDLLTPGGARALRQIALDRLP